MESTTLDLIHTNKTSARQVVKADITEFAAIAAIKEIMIGSTSGGQGQWAIVWPASRLSASQRNQLDKAGWKYRRVGLGDGKYTDHGFITSVIGWAKN